MADKIPLKLVDLGSGAGELREFATGDTIPAVNLLGVYNLGLGQFAKNKIINGAMDIAQRGTSFPAIVVWAYSLDRWFYAASTSAVLTVAQQADAPASSLDLQSSLRVQVTSADTAIASTDSAHIVQRIEGYNARSLIGKTFTLSFWCRSSKTGIHCVAFRNAGPGVDRSYVMEYSVSTANTWEYKTLTLTNGLITSGANWNWTNGIGLQVQFGMMAGSNFHTSANAWQSGDYYTTANQVNCLDTVGNIFAITGVQLEVGAVATPFEHRLYGQELALCRRYGRPLPGQALSQVFSASAGAGIFYLDTPMRATPTLSTTSGYTVATASGGSVSAPTISLTNLVDNTVRLDFSGASGLVAGSSAVLFPPAGVFLSAEL